jgi:Na+/H+-dicarboxylate symporter
MKLSTPFQIVLGVVIGCLLGSFFPDDQLTNLGEIGKVVIHWIKLVAGPFLFLTIVSSIIQVELKWRDGFRLISIAILNTSIALVIGMVLSLLFFKNGDPLHSDISAQIPQAPVVSLGLSGWVKTFMPTSLFAPFINNDILLIALCALILGIAIRKTKELSEETKKKLTLTAEKANGVVGVILHWLIKMIPFAVCLIIASTVSKFGFNVFSGLSKFVIVVLAAFTLQIVGVYGVWIFLIAKYKPKEFIKSAKIPFLYSLGVNSSLATLPLTLEALKKLKVSDRSASLGAGVATNLNNDGIVLYEAMAVFFIAFSYNVPMDLGHMVLAALTCIVASMGITGIPEAGFISLSVVIGILGLPTEALPLLLAVDWIIARCRSAVNVLSDITLSIAMDATDD